jgi:hypothetical protein
VQTKEVVKASSPYDCLTRRRTTEPAGFILDHYLATQAQHDYVEGLLAEVKRAYRRTNVYEQGAHFFKHVLASTILRRERWEAMQPVASVLIQKHLPTFDKEGNREATSLLWEPLARAGLLLVDDEYDPFEGKSREFGVPPAILERFLSLRGGPRVCLFSGRSTRRRMKTKLTARGGKSIKNAIKRSRPDRFRVGGREVASPVAEALSHWKEVYVPVNAACVKSWLRHSKKHVRRLQARWKRAGGREGTPEHRAYLKARGGHTNDLAVWDRICTQSRAAPCPTSPLPSYPSSLWPESPLPEGQLPGDILVFAPAYEVVELSGRLRPTCALLNARRGMKKAAAHGIPQLRNYDIASSHPTFLRPRLEAAGVSTRWLDTYAREGKAAYADKVGVTVDTWKTIFYALFCQARLHGSFQEATARTRFTGQAGTLPTIAATLREAEGDTDALYERACTLLAPLQRDLKAWLDYLLGPWLEKHKAYGGEQEDGSPRYFVKNACGVKFYPLDYDAGHERRAKACAWALQGDESLFIHVLTLLGPKHGYVAVANEHDGLQTLGTIPQEAVEEARQLTGFEDVCLKEKPLAAGFEPGTYAGVDARARRMSERQEESAQSTSAQSISAQQASSQRTSARRRSARRSSRRKASQSRRMHTGGAFPA